MFITANQDYKNKVVTVSFVDQCYVSIVIVAIITLITMVTGTNTTLFAPGGNHCQGVCFHTCRLSEHLF